METALVIIHVLVATGIIGLVLIQHGKGADAGAAFGAGAAGGVSGSVFGAKGSSNFLSRSTAILATLFFVTSLSLAFVTKSSHQATATSLVDQVTAEEPVIDTTKSAVDAPVVPVQEGTAAPENP
jgi:preprotein translocase subunit SecG